MKEIKRRETELLAKVCRENGISLKLARDLIKTAESYSYQNWVESLYKDNLRRYCKSNN